LRLAATAYYLAADSGRTAAESARLRSACAGTAYAAGTCGDWITNAMRKRPVG
jgi:hypothetical protein